MKKVIVVIEGGVCQAVYSDDETIEVEILDRDNQNEEIDKDELKRFDELDSEIKKLNAIY